MFEELFTCPATIAKYREARLVEERQRYLRHCAASGTLPGTLRNIARFQLVLIDLLDLQDGEPVCVSRIEGAVHEWSLTRACDGSQQRSLKSVRWFLGHSIRCLRFLGWLEEAKEEGHPHSAEVVAYAAWMRHVRGLSESTICIYCRVAGEFFHWLSGRGIPLASVTISNIDDAIATKAASRNYGRTTLSNHARYLRAFFWFAETQSWCRPGLAAGIVPPRMYPDEPIPKGFDRDEVQRLLATTEGGRALDIRDRAILMLLITYGLRASEVCSLQLESIDWEQETLRVFRPKTGRTDDFPLSPGVGNAVLRYLLEVRPQERPERALFLTLQSPIRPAKGSTLSSIVARRARSLGIAGKCRRTHALRHATAQRLLDDGLSMKEIGDFLGHRSPAATAVYAKIDLATLRVVADFSLEGLGHETT